MSALYMPSDHLALVRGAKLHGLIMNGHPRVTADGETIWEPGSPSEMAELRQIEDRFGLNPKSRRLMQWQIAPDEGQTPTPHVPRERKLRAVDSG